jgi:mono/diheme cytochrome c family protein
MRNLPLRNASIRLLLVVPLAGLPLTLALGHEAHDAECNETAMNALKADIQAMDAGEAKTTATKEMDAAQAMMAKNDMEGCKSHIHSAMEATEK